MLLLLLPLLSMLLRAGIVALLLKLPLTFLLSTAVATHQLPSTLAVAATVASVAAATVRNPAPEVIESIAIIDRQN